MPGDPALAHWRSGRDRSRTHGAAQQFADLGARPRRPAEPARRTRQIGLIGLEHANARCLYTGTGGARRHGKQTGTSGSSGSSGPSGPSGIRGIRTGQLGLLEGSPSQTCGSNGTENDRTRIACEAADGPRPRPAPTLRKTAARRSKKRRRKKDPARTAGNARPSQTTQTAQTGSTEATPTASAPPQPVLLRICPAERGPQRPGPKLFGRCQGSPLAAPIQAPSRCARGLVANHPRPLARERLGPIRCGNGGAAFAGAAATATTGWMAQTGITFTGFAR